MKWFILISVPVMITGWLLFGIAVGTSEKPDSPKTESIGYTQWSVANAISAGDASYPEQTYTKPEPDTDQSLLFKNILVCIL